jgi:hypothetical protein
MTLSLRGRLVVTTMVAALAAVTVLVIGLQILLAHQTDDARLAVGAARAGRRGRHDGAVPR